MIQNWSTLHIGYNVRITWEGRGYQIGKLLLRLPMDDVRQITIMINGLEFVSSSPSIHHHQHHSFIPSAYNLRNCEIFKEIWAVGHSKRYNCKSGHAQQENSFFQSLAFYFNGELEGKLFQLVTTRYKFLAWVCSSILPRQ